MAEQALCIAVLQRAVEDALETVAEGGVYETRVRTCQEARKYLTTSSKDLALICAGAGLDMQAVIDAMQKRIALAPSPEEIAKAKVVGNHGKSHTYQGETLTLTEWSERTGISRHVLANRMKKRKTIAQAIGTPVIHGIQCKQAG